MMLRIAAAALLILASVDLSAQGRRGARDDRDVRVGRSAEEDLQAAIRAEIEATEGVEDLLNAITLQLGPQVMLAIKVRMTPGVSIENAIETLNKLERSIKAKFPEVAWCFAEPDVAD